MPARSIEIRLDAAIPDRLWPEVATRLAFVDEDYVGVKRGGDGATVVVAIRDRKATPATDAQLTAKFRHVIDAIVGGANLPEPMVLEDHVFGHVANGDDPTSQLLAEHELVQELDGVYSLGPRLAALAGYFDDRLVAIAHSVNASAFRFPALISAATLERLDYFRAFPHTLTFATYLKRDIDVIERFAANACCGEDGIDMIAESVAAPRALLSPAVCYHLYVYFQGREIPAEGITATAVGHCFRQEASNLVSLERLWDFTMREIMFVGDADHVASGRELVRTEVRALLQSLQLDHRVEAAHDPFFVGEFAKQTAFQQGFGLKQEIRAALPYSGGTLAVGSYNYHQDFFGRRLDMRLADSEPAHTGCAAFGLERMVFAFVAQHGIDPAGWPDAIRAGVAR